MPETFSQPSSQTSSQPSMPPTTQASLPQGRSLAASGLDLHSLIGLLLFCAVLLVILFAPLRTPFYYYDEGFAVLNASRVLQGELPYRDFWAIYPPGQLYTLAFWFKVFGVSLLVARVYDTFVRFALVLGVFFTARRLSNPPLAVVAGLAATLTMTSVGFYSYAVYPALAWGIWGLWCLLRYAQSGQRRWLWAAGMWSGVASLYRWDIGLYTGFALAGAVFIYRLFGGPSPVSAWPPKIVNVLAAIRESLFGLAGTFLVFGVGYGLVGVTRGAGNLLDQVLLFPATQLHDVRWLAYPSLIPPRWPKLSDFWNFYSWTMDWVRFYLPLIVFAIALIYFAYALASRRITWNARQVGALAAALLGPLVFAQALSRYDYIHVLPAAIVAIPLAAWWFAQTDSGSRVLRALKITLYVFTPILAAVYFSAPLDVLTTTLEDMPPWGCYARLPRAACVWIWSENQQKAVEYIQAHTAPGEAIYVGNQRHDYILVSDVGFYWLADRPSATRYSELHPGVATTLPVQQEIAVELAAKPVQWVVLVDIPRSSEPNDSGVSSGVFYLDEYIQAHYSLQAEFGEYKILERLP